MEKSILKLGKKLSKTQQQFIYGGTDHDECGYGTCSGGATCYHGVGGSGTYCGGNDPNALAVAPPPRPLHDLRVSHE